MFLHMVEPLQDDLSVFQQVASGSISICTPRLQLWSFRMADAEQVFACITPAVARFMTWDPPHSFAEFRAGRQAKLDAGDSSSLSLVVRRDDNDECLGVAALEAMDASCPTLGLWLKVEAQSHGYGREVVSAIVDWASRHLGPTGFYYSVAVENIRSRRIAESLGGVVVSRHTTQKYEAVVYQIPSTVRREAP